jgi:hypothetical protein
LSESIDDHGLSVTTRSAEPIRRSGGRASQLRSARCSNERFVIRLKHNFAVVGEDGLNNPTAGSSKSISPGRGQHMCTLKLLPHTWLLLLCAACGGPARYIGAPKPPPTMPGAICGVVYDAATRQPLEGVHVTITPVPEGTTILGTDARGFFCVTGLARQHYDVLFELPTYHSYLRADFMLPLAGAQLSIPLLPVNLRAEECVATGESSTSRARSFKEHHASVAGSRRPYTSGPTRTEVVSLRTALALALRRQRSRVGPSGAVLDAILQGESSRV